MSHINPEIVANTSNQLASLQAGRLEMSAQAARLEMRSAFTKNSLDRPEFSTGNPTVNGVASDAGNLQAKDLLAFEAVGMDVATILAKTDDPETMKYDPTYENPIAEAVIGTERLQLFPYSHGVTMRVKDTDDPRGRLREQSGAIREVTVERLKKSPAHRELHRIGELMQTESNVPAVVLTQPFDPSEDPLGTLVFLQDIGLAGSYRDTVRNMRHGATATEQISNELAHLKPHTAERQETETTTTFTWGKGARRHLIIDKASGNYTYGAEQVVDAHYPEVANQAPDIEGTPFIETDCAREMAQALDSAGVMFHPKLQVEMMQPKPDDRYGVAYTEMSRIVAKWINDPKRTRVTDLFVPKNEAFHGKALATNLKRGALYDYDAAVAAEAGQGRDHEAEARQALAGADVSQVHGEAAATLLGMVCGALDRPVDQIPDTDLPVTREAIKIRDGACFDVALYYYGAADRFNRRDSRLKHIDVNGVSLLEKPATQGKHTFLSTAPLLFNGVKLPKGSLFARDTQGDWAFLRLTPFAFDAAEDQRAFGTELDKAYKYETEAIQAIGGTSLGHVVEASINTRQTV